MTPHIGMKVWRFDINRRVYKRDENGRAIGGPIWREHWVPLEIVGETTRSWIVARPGMPASFGAKVSKKEWPREWAVSEADIERRDMIENGTNALARRVERCRDYDTLRAIEALLDAQSVQSENTK